MLQNGTPSPARSLQSRISGCHPGSRDFRAACQRKIRSPSLLIAIRFATDPQE